MADPRDSLQGFGGMRLAVWQIRSDVPVRVVASNVRLERKLED